jgi:hypothetical protein
LQFLDLGVDVFVVAMFNTVANHYQDNLGVQGLFVQSIPFLDLPSFEVPIGGKPLNQQLDA